MEEIDYAAVLNQEDFNILDQAPYLPAVVAAAAAASDIQTSPAISDHQAKDDEIISRIREKRKPIFKLLKRQNFSKKKQQMEIGSTLEGHQGYQVQNLQFGRNPKFVGSDRVGQLLISEQQISTMFSSILNLPKELHLEEADASIDNNASVRNNDDDIEDEFLEYQQAMPNLVESVKYDKVRVRKRLKKSDDIHVPSLFNHMGQIKEEFIDAEAIMETLLKSAAAATELATTTQDDDEGEENNAEQQIPAELFVKQLEAQGIHSSEIWEHVKLLQAHQQQSSQMVQSQQKQSLIIKQQPQQLQKLASAGTQSNVNQNKVGSQQSQSSQMPMIHLNSNSYSRREKSLEELSKKFLTIFLQKESMMISLDKITQQLDVERRRIYDIINILESLKLVTRRGKNNYKWNGFDQIFEVDQVVADIDDDDDDESAGGNNQNASTQAGGGAGTAVAAEQNEKKEKSLEILSIGFLKLFLNYKSTLSLEEAARKLSPNNCENQKIKTKIRRLYDIANVFKSLGLIRKVQLNQTKKPAFQWVGISGLHEFYNSSNNCEENIECEENGLQPAAATAGTISEHQVIEEVDDHFEEFAQINAAASATAVGNSINNKDVLITPRKNGKSRKGSSASKQLLNEDEFGMNRFSQMFFEEAMNSLLLSQQKSKFMSGSLFQTTPDNNRMSSLTTATTAKAANRMGLFQESANDAVTAAGEHNFSSHFDKDSLQFQQILSTPTGTQRDIAGRLFGSANSSILSSSKNSAFKRVDKSVPIINPSQLMVYQQQLLAQSLAAIAAGNDKNASASGKSTNFVVVPSPQMKASKSKPLLSQNDSENNSLGFDACKLEPEGDAGYINSIWEDAAALARVDENGNKMKQNSSVHHGFGKFNLLNSNNIFDSKSMNLLHSQSSITQQQQPPYFSKMKTLFSSLEDDDDEDEQVNGIHHQSSRFGANDVVLKHEEDEEQQQQQLDYAESSQDHAVKVEHTFHDETEQQQQQKQQQEPTKNSLEFNEKYMNHRKQEVIGGVVTMSKRRLKKLMKMERGMIGLALAGGVDGFDNDDDDDEDSDNCLEEEEQQDDVEKYDTQQNGEVYDEDCKKDIASNVDFDDDGLEEDVEEDDEEKQVVFSQDKERMLLLDESAQNKESKMVSEEIISTSGSSNLSSDLKLYQIPMECSLSQAQELTQDDSLYQQLEPIRLNFHALD